MTSRALLVACLVVAVVPSVCLAVPLQGDMSIPDASDFNQCFCWDSLAMTWCGEGGTTTFWRNSCRRYAYYTMWWVVPVVLIALSFACFPFLFACARLCCNCCGGRQPSYGCCCPTTSHDILRDTENPFMDDPLLATIPTRRYKRSTVRCTQFFTAVALTLLLISGISVAATNPETRNDTTGFIDTLSSTATTVNGLYSAGWNSFQSVMFTNPSLTSQVNVGALAAAVQQTSNTYSTFLSGTRNLREAEASWYGRATLTSWALMLPVGALSVVCLLMHCRGVRGGVFSVLAGIVSLLGMFVAAAFGFHMLMSQLGNAAINNYVATTAPLALGALQYNNMCNEPTMLLSYTAVGVAWQSNLCSVLSQMCTSGGYACQSNWASSCPPSSVIGNAPPTTATIMFLRQVVNQATTNGAYCGGSTCSVDQCAATPSPCPSNMASEAAQANQLVGLFMYVSSLSQAYEASYNCMAYQNALASGSNIYAGLNSVVQDYNGLAPNMLLSTMTLVVAVVLVVRGAKRYANGLPRRREIGMEQETFNTAPVYGTPIVAHEETPMYGTINTEVVKGGSKLV